MKPQVTDCYCSYLFFRIYICSAIIASKTFLSKLFSFVSLSLALSHTDTDTHTHTHILSLSLYIYIYIYMCVCMCIFQSVYRPVSLSMSIYLSWSALLSPYISLSLSVCLSLSLSIYIYIYIYIYSWKGYSIFFPPTTFEWWQRLTFASTPFFQAIFLRERFSGCSHALFYLFF